MITEFPRHVHESLKYYVYIYSDPRDGKPFYVGKGMGNRAFSHLRDDSESEKVRRIKEILNDGVEPTIEILVHGIADEETAMRIEASVIDLIGIDKLTNAVRGYESRSYGRMNLDQILATYDVRKAEIVDPVILININRTFRFGMQPIELYDATRSAWVVGDRKDQAKYALAVYQSVVQEVYEIAAWLRKGSTLKAKEPEQAHGPGEDRWEFVGRIAEPKIRDRYRYRDVSEYVGGQNPIRYVGF
jgi:uncharacterized protein